MSTKYSRKIVATIVLSQSEFSDHATKSRSGCSEFQTKFQGT